MRAGERAGERAGAQRGFTYVWAMAAIALLGIALAALGTAWSAELRRERERELLRVGTLYAQAIASYRRVSPGSEARYPQTLEALLLDTRFVGTLRHLRTLYPDPLDPARPWGLVRDAQGHIAGVYSRSDDPPLRTAPLAIDGVHLPAAARYSDWKFTVKADP